MNISFSFLIQTLFIFQLYGPTSFLLASSHFVFFQKHIFINRIILVLIFLLPPPILLPLLPYYKFSTLLPPSFYHLLYFHCSFLFQFFSFFFLYSFSILSFFLSPFVSATLDSPTLVSTTFHISLNTLSFYFFHSPINLRVVASKLQHLQNYILLLFSDYINLHPLSVPLVIDVYFYHIFNRFLFVEEVINISHIYGFFYFL